MIQLLTNRQTEKLYSDTCYITMERVSHSPSLRLAPLHAKCQSHKRYYHKLTDIKDQTSFRRTDGPTDRRTNRPSYRDASTRLKRRQADSMDSTSKEFIPLFRSYDYAKVVDTTHGHAIPFPVWVHKTKTITKNRTCAEGTVTYLQGTE